MVRTTLMRATVHLVSARDCLRLAPAAPGDARAPFTGATFARQSRASTSARWWRPGARDAAPSRWATARSAARWPSAGPGRPELARVRGPLPLPVVQLPPRGTSLRASGRPAVVTPVEHWLGPSWRRRGADELVLRYLGGVRPRDGGRHPAWSGLAGDRRGGRAAAAAASSATRTSAAASCSTSRMARSRTRTSPRRRGSWRVRQRPARPRRPHARAALGAPARRGRRSASCSSTATPGRPGG